MTSFISNIEIQYNNSIISSEHLAQIILNENVSINNITNDLGISSVATEEEEETNDDVPDYACASVPVPVPDLVPVPVPVPVPDPVRVSTLTSAVRSLGSGQDHVIGTKGLMNPHTGELFDLLEVYDGHGGDTCIDAIRSMPTAQIIQDFALPEVEIQHRLSLNQKVSVSSGSTFACAKIYKNRVECRTVGDSQIVVFVNDEIRYTSPLHNWFNLDERVRIGKKSGFKPSPMRDTCPELLSTTALTMEQAWRLNWGPSVIIVPTQSLGHYGITGLAAATYTIEFTDEDRVVVVAATDGVWDVMSPKFEEDKERFLTMTAEQIAQVAAERWNQEWDFHPYPQNLGKDVSKESFPDKDDVGIIVGKR